MDVNIKDNNKIKSIFKNYNKLNKIISIANILQILNITQLPNYWMSDDELAAIADYHNHETYIYDVTNKIAII
jgi:NADH:ubiquinone oxidoreductase subunit E